jgi:transcriptional regulator with XRE-family HTH domain
MLMCNLYNAFVANVNAALIQKGWSRKQLAAAMGVTPGAVTQQLNGYSSVGLEVVEKYAAALGKKPEALLRTPRNNMAQAS